jgi:hypothetical protein
LLTLQLANHSVVVIYAAMQQSSPESPSTDRIVIEAIARRRLLSADYNGRNFRLAPHLLLERRGDLFIAAYNPDKARRADEDPSLGRFKLKGLSNLVLSEDEFEPIIETGTCLLDGEKEVFAV